LNAAELQAALIGELTTDAELKDEVRRLRELVAKLGATLQQLSVSVAPARVTRLHYSANDLMEDLQKKIARDFPEQSQRIKWDVSLDGTMLDIDPALLGWAAAELFDNAFRNNGGELSAHGCKEGDRFIFALQEPKSGNVELAKWEEPLGTVQHGHYGLGLRRARAIVAEHGGELTSEWDPKTSTLTSRIILPCSTERS
jgi:K+-sensing histidine kinase KdpD